MEPTSNTPPILDRLYSPLTDTDEIRLLHLQPGSESEKIRCTIAHAKFADSSSYEALSYEWGPRHNPETIEIDGDDFVVRENLGLALHQLRSEKDTRVLWVDALCINQENTWERNHQVSQMGMVYHRASSVVVWLGATDDKCQIAFQVLSTVGKWKRFAKPSNDPTELREDHNDLESIYHLFTRGYWRRLWIIQEVLMAKKFVLHCGSGTCSGFHISYLVRWLLGIQLDTPQGILEQERYTIVSAILNSIPARLLLQRERPSYRGPFSVRIGTRETHVPVRLCTLYQQYSGAECEDQRDKIFGLHSLAENCCQNATPVDYSLPWPEICQMVINHELLEHGRIPNFKDTNPDFLVQNWRELYNELSNPERTSDSALDDLIKKTIENPEDHYSATVYRRGCIQYICPPISANLSTECPSPQKLTERIQTQLEYISNLQHDGEDQHLRMTSEIDVVGGFARFDANPVRELISRGASRYSGQGNTNTSREAVARGFDKVIRAAAHQASRFKNRRLAFEENGLIIIVSDAVKVGEVVYQFSNTDVLAIVSWEREPPGPELVLRRAVNFLAAPSTVAADICGRPMTDIHATADAVELVITADGLWRLTRGSATPNKESALIEPEVQRSRN